MKDQVVHHVLGTGGTRAIIGRVPEGIVMSELNYFS